MSGPPRPASAGDDDPVPSVESLSRHALSGVKWGYAQSGITALLQLIYTGTMSRLLEDEAFGLLALAQLVVNFGLYFAQLGVGRALVQHKQPTVTHVRAAFTSSVALGLGVCALAWVSAPSLAGVFREDGFVPVMRAMSVAFVLLGLGTTAQSMLRRQLRFRELALAESFAFFIGYIVVGIGTALLGGGVWSLVAALLTTHGVAAALMLMRSRHAMRFTADMSAYRDLYAFGSRASLIQVLEYLGNNLDTFVAGRYLATGRLGQYNRAFYLVQLPIHYLVLSLSGVLFPSMSRIQDQLDRLRRAFTGVLMVIGTVMVPLLAGLAVAAVEVVEVVLGPGWEGTASAVPLFCLAAAGKVLSRFPAILAEARGELNLKLSVEIGTTLLLGGLLLLAIGGDLRAYAAASAGREVVRHLVYVSTFRRLVGLQWRDLPAVYLPIGFATAVVAAAIWGAREGLLVLGSPLLATFAAEVTAGALSLALVLRSRPLTNVRGELASRLEGAGLLPAENRCLAIATRLVLGRAAGGRSQAGP